MVQGLRFSEDPWLGMDIGFAQRRRVAGKQAGGIEEAVRAFGMRSATPHPEANPMKFHPLETAIPGAMPTPASKIAAPAGGGSLPAKPDQPEYQGPASIKPQRDVTTGLYRIDTPREDLVQTIRGAGGEARSYFNPHTGTNYPSILEAMWGGVKKPMKERVTSQAAIQTGKMDLAQTQALIGRMEKVLAGLTPPKPGAGKSGAGADTVARPGGPPTALDILGLQGFETAETPGLPDLPAYYEGMTEPEDMPEQRKKKLLAEDFPF